MNDSTAYAADVYNNALSPLFPELLQSKVGVPPHSSRIGKISILDFDNKKYVLPIKGALVEFSEKQ